MSTWETTGTGLGARLDRLRHSNSTVWVTMLVASVLSLSLIHI